jgi:predicted aconitase
MAQRTITVRLKLRIGEFIDTITRGREIVNDAILDRVRSLLTEDELQQVKNTVNTEHIDATWAVDMIAFGCPADQLQNADVLAKATGGDREQVKSWVIEGRLEEALAALHEGRIGDLYEDQP